MTGLGQNGHLGLNALISVRMVRDLEPDIAQIPDLRMEVGNVLDRISNCNLAVTRANVPNVSYIFIESESNSFGKKLKDSGSLHWDYFCTLSFP